jgi:Arc/MetJ-type ribon-helix-helix transcriptional regulator
MNENIKLTEPVLEVLTRVMNSYRFASREEAVTAAIQLLNSLATAKSAYNEVIMRNTVSRRERIVDVPNFRNVK